MKQVRIGDVPLEFFTGVGELRKHDTTGNRITCKDVLYPVKKESVSFETAFNRARRKERKREEYRQKIGVLPKKEVRMKGVSVTDLL